MGMYDQLLQLNQHGLDQGLQIAQLRAQQPTMADVFMDRFRQGGQDRLAQQKTAQEAKMHEATIENMKAQRLLQAGTLGAVYATPDNANFLKSVIGGIPGMEDASVNFQGSKERQIVSAEQMQAERLRQKAEADRAKNLIDELRAQHAGLKPTSPLGRLAFDEANGWVKPDVARAKETKDTTIVWPASVSNPMPVVKSETGERKLVIPGKHGGLEEVKDYEPEQKPGQTRSKPAEPEEIISQIDKAIKLLPRASSGGLQAGATKTKDFFGIATGKSGVDAQLATISAFLTSSTPRLGGNTSDADRKFYQQYMGDAANTSLPVASRIEALKAARAIVQKSLKRRASDQNQMTFEDFMK